MSRTAGARRLVLGLGVATAIGVGGFSLLGAGADVPPQPGSPGARHADSTPPAVPLAVARPTPAGSGQRDAVAPPREPGAVLRIVDARGTPAAGVRVGVRLDGDPAVRWPASTDRDGECAVPGSAAPHESWLVVDASERYRLETRLGPLVDVGSTVLTLPAESPVEVEIANAGRGACSIWCGPAADGPLRVPLPREPSWALVHRPGLVDAQRGRATLSLPDAMSFAVRATVENGRVVPEAYAQPFAGRLSFLAIRDAERPRLGVRIADAAGRTVDIEAWASLQSGRGELRAELARGHLHPSKGLWLGDVDAAALLQVVAGDGERWSVSVASAARTTPRGLEVVLTRGAGARAVALAAPGFDVARVYAMLDDGSLRAAAPHVRATATRFFWMSRGDRVLVGGVPAGAASIWMLAADGRLAVARAARAGFAPTVPIEQVGARILRAGVLRKLGANKRSLVSFEIRLPGQSADGWLCVETDLWHPRGDAQWIKVASHGVRGRFRVVVGGAERVVETW